MLIDIIFFTVFLCQIILISLFYAKKMHDRSSYILNTYSASEYPKLYENSKYADPVKFLQNSFRAHYRFSIAVAALGFSILFGMLITGYAPSKIKDAGQLIFVMLFFVLQATPYVLSTITMQNWRQNMRRSERPKLRKADLRPRKLFEFISPIYIAIAVFAFIGCMVYYLYNKGFSTPWDWQSYVTVIGMTTINLGMIAASYRMLRGKKLDPYQANKDQRKFIETIIRVYVFASIMISVQLIVSDAINQHGWDMFEPVMISVYNQIVIIFGIGEVLRRYKVENIDFNVYRQDRS